MDEWTGPCSEVPAGARLVYVSGQLGIHPDGTTPECAEAQAEVCLRNVRRILGAAQGQGGGGGLDRCFLCVCVCVSFSIIASHRIATTRLPFLPDEYETNGEKHKGTDSACCETKMCAARGTV